MRRRTVGRSRTRVQRRRIEAETVPPLPCTAVSGHAPRRRSRLPCREPFAKRLGFSNGLDRNAFRVAHRRRLLPPRRHHRGLRPGRRAVPQHRLLGLRADGDAARRGGDVRPPRRGLPGRRAAPRLRGPLPRARGHPLRPRAVHRHHAPQRDRHPDGRGAGAQLGQHQLRGLRPLRERGLRRAGVRHLRHHARRRRGGDRPRHRARHLPELRDDRRRGDGPAETMTPAGYVGAIPLVPLAGAAVLGLGGAPLQRRFGKLPVSVLACGTVATSFVLSVVAFFQLAGLAPEHRLLLADLFPWVHVGTLNVDVAFGVDPLSAVMILVVTGIGGLIHLYATGYMHDDPAFWRFFAYLNLFTFAMLTLVLGDNLLLMFVGWEGVGFCSWALIGFWHKELYNTTAGNKAFIVNRIGDFGFVLGLFLLFWTLDARGHGTLVFRELAQHAHLLEGQVFWGLPVATLVTLFLFVRATGKSAQIPLYVWLPDAMAGPTPVSALIHAATMVTAGVYMIARTNFLFAMAPTTLHVVAFIGAATSLLAAVIATAQTDIKKVLAYSTVSQLGYMFLALGVGATGAGVFHLVTHAFFKALLFLAAGSVIHGMGGEQDMARMGALRTRMPVTF